MQWDLFLKNGFNNFLIILHWHSTASLYSINKYTADAITQEIHQTGEKLLKRIEHLLVYVYIDNVDLCYMYYLAFFLVTWTLLYLPSNRAVGSQELLRKISGQ